MIDASSLHDALRAEGLVPAAEDVHLTACSTWYHHALKRAAEAIDPEVDELELHMHCASQDDLDEEEERADAAERDAIRLAKELENSMKRVAELERALEIATEQLKGST